MSQYKVYLADDERMIREGIAGLIPWSKLDLSFMGCAADGRAAYRDIVETKPDIVITDIKMPIMDGIELIRQTRAVLKNTQFIVLSGYGEFELAAQAMKFGVKHYLLKPCDESEIITVLNSVIEDLTREHERERTAGVDLQIRNRLLQMQSVEEVHSFILAEPLPESEVVSIDRATFGSGKIAARMQALIHEQLGSNELSLQWLAQNHFYMNAEYLGKVFRKETGIKFNAYLAHKRMEWAKVLIVDYPEMKMYEIAEQVGYFGDQQYFTNVFKKMTGITPLEFKKNQLK